MGAATYNGQYTTGKMTAANANTSPYANSIFKYDPIYWNANGNIILASGGANPGPTLGTFEKCDYYSNTGGFENRNYWQGGQLTLNGSPVQVMYNSDPNIQYMIQVSTSANTAVENITLTSAMVGNNANFNVGGSWGPPVNSPYLDNPATGNTVSGQSAYYLDLSTVGNGAELNLKIMGIAALPNNEYGTPFNIALVRINNNVLQGGTGTAGV